MYQGQWFPQLGHIETWFILYYHVCVCVSVCVKTKQKGADRDQKSHM